MSKWSERLGQAASRHASRAAVDAVRGQKDGIRAYRLAGRIFFWCGIGWLLLTLIPVLCKNPFRDWGWMLVLSAIQIVVGLVLVFLSKKSKGFQKWAEKDFRNWLKLEEKFAQKVRIGKVTLPMTYGDAFALIVLGVIGLILMVILGIGSLQGWVK